MIRDYSKFLPPAAKSGSPKRNLSTLEALGWQPFFAQQISVEELEDTAPVRVTEVHRSGLHALGDGIEATIPPGPDATVGDWLLLVRSADPSTFDGSTSLDKVYRWTQIVGANEAVDGKRSFAIANDDFLKPNVLGRAVFMRGVKAVYEKTIRIENSTAWN